MPQRRQGTPFPFEGPVPPELMIDRRDELRELARRAGDRVNVRLVAPRRFGKTTLLGAHAAQLQETGWRTAHIDLSRVADLTDVTRRVAAAYAPLDSGWVRAHLGAALSRIGIAISATGPSVSFGPRPGLAQSEAETVLHTLLDLPLQLHERDATPTLVVFDEFQDLLVARKDLDGLLRSRVQYHGDAAAYVFAGSQPSMMRELFERRERPFFGQALALELDALPVDAVLGELLQRFGAEGLDPGAALGALVAFAAGHPQRSMLLAYLLADRVAAGAEPTPALAEEVLDEALRLTDAAHAAVWQAADPVERAVLAGVADGAAPTSTKLAAEHGVARTTLSAAADRLVAQGHLVRRPTPARVVDPLFAEWLRRR